MAPAEDVLRRLLQLVSSDQAALPALHARWLQHLDALWRDRRAPTTSVLDFPPVLSEAHGHMTVALQRLRLDADLTLDEVSAGFAQQLSQLKLGTTVAITPNEHQLVAMGFDAEVARHALEIARGDLQAAVLIILER